MTFQMVGTIQKYICISTDVKTTSAVDGSAYPPGSELLEADTTMRYVWSGSSWAEIGKLYCCTS